MITIQVFSRDHKNKSSHHEETISGDSVHEEGAGRYQRDTLSEAVVSLRTLVTFVTWLISRTEFSSSELVV